MAMLALPFLDDLLPSTYVPADRDPALHDLRKQLAVVRTFIDQVDRTSPDTLLHRSLSEQLVDEVKRLEHYALRARAR